MRSNLVTKLVMFFCGFKPGNSSNLWFEESICEIASLFVLKKLENQWTIQPPFPNWHEYAPEFTKYAMERIKKHENPMQMDLHKWFLENEDALKADPTNRIRNLNIAIRLLPFSRVFQMVGVRVLFE